MLLMHNCPECEKEFHASYLVKTHLLKDHEFGYYEARQLMRELE